MWFIHEDLSPLNIRNYMRMADARSLDLMTIEQPAPDYGITARMFLQANPSRLDFIITELSVIL